MTKTVLSGRNNRLYNGMNVLTGEAGWWTGLVSTDWFDCKAGNRCRHFYPLGISNRSKMERLKIPKIDRTSPYATV
jgi:hypothetical protein